MHLYTNNTHTDDPKRHHQCCSLFFSSGSPSCEEFGTKAIFLLIFPFPRPPPSESTNRSSDRDPRRHFLFLPFRKQFRHTPNARASGRGRYSHGLGHSWCQGHGFDGRVAACSFGQLGRIETAQLALRHGCEENELSWFWNDHWHWLFIAHPRRRALVDPLPRKLVSGHPRHSTPPCRERQDSVDRVPSLTVGGPV